MSDDMRRATACVHAGTKLDPHTGGVNTPIYTSSAFLHPNPGGLHGLYPRYMNAPTLTAPGDKIAALEKMEAGLVLASGMAAVSHALFAFLAQGDHLLLQGDLYGGTHHFVTTECPRYGVEYDMVHSLDPADLAAAVRPETKVVYVESPTNPLLNVIDLAALAMIDNTFATPVNQNPADFGFDVVVHSATKYLSGHSDLSSGAICTSTELMTPVITRLHDFGASLGAIDCYLLERSMKTLEVRMQRHNANAQKIAEYLENHPNVRSVNYPGLPSHPSHELAARQMSGFGGMLSFELDCEPAEMDAALARLRIFARAVSLGGVESLVTVPATTSHSTLTPEERARAGVSDGLVRVSVGIEDPDDLIADLERALAI